MRYTRDQAASYKIPFGKFEGQSLLKISSEIDGMKYLINLQLQKYVEACPPHLMHDFKMALWVFIHTVDTDRETSYEARVKFWRTQLFTPLSKRP